MNDAPDLSGIMAFRGVHALCTVKKDGFLQATHYATCLVFGPHPIWGVWTAKGHFLRFYGSKQQIADAYPKLAWRRKSATWTMREVHNMDAQAKRSELEAMYKKRTDNVVPLKVVK